MKRLLRGIYRVLTFLLYYCIAAPILWALDTLVFGLRVRGKEQVRALKEQGAVVVCNHVHTLDCTFLGLLLFPRRMTFTSLERLFRVPVIAQLIHWLGSVPVPEKSSGLREFLRRMTERLHIGQLVCIYPEGELIPYCRKLREFEDGAFSIAVRAEAPVLPVVVTQRERRGLYRLLKRKPCLTITALEPVYPPREGPVKRRAMQLRKEVETRMQQAMPPDRRDVVLSEDWEYLSFDGQTSEAVLNGK